MLGLAVRSHSGEACKTARASVVLGHSRMDRCAHKMKAQRRSGTGSAEATAAGASLDPCLES